MNSVTPKFVNFQDVKPLGAPVVFFSKGTEKGYPKPSKRKGKQMSSIAKAMDRMDLPVEGVILASARPTLGTPRIGRVNGANALNALAALGDLAQVAGGVGQVVGAASAVEANNAAVDANNAVANAANAQAAAVGGAV